MSESTNMWRKFDEKMKSILEQANEMNDVVNNRLQPLPDRVSKVQELIAELLKKSVATKNEALAKDVTAKSEKLDELLKKITDTKTVTNTQLETLNENLTALEAYANKNENDNNETPAAPAPEPTPEPAPKPSEEIQKKEITPSTVQDELTSTTALTQGGYYSFKKYSQKKKSKKFKKHYMWTKKGKRYMVKSHKQHLKGVKLGHTHKKPKKSRRRTRK